MHAQLEKHWERLCRMTDLPLRANSGRAAVDLGASGDLLLSVSWLSRDIRHYSRSDSHYGKL